jgi:two-component system response regulator LytT
MPDGDGIEFATWTRTIKGYSLTPIIFITGYDVYVLPAINLAHCYGYLLKPYHSEELVTMICELMTQFIQNPVAEVDFMTIAKKGLNYRIELKDILYIEIIMKNIDVRTKDKVYKLSRLSLKKIMEQLPAGTFLQCHRSIVVNINCIVKYESRSKDAYVVLNNGEQLPVGNKYRSIVGSLIKQSNR